MPVEETEVVTTSCPAIPRNVIATGGDNSIVLTWDEAEEGTAAPTAYVAHSDAGGNRVSNRCPQAPPHVLGWFAQRQERTRFVSVRRK